MYSGNDKIIEGLIQLAVKHHIDPTYLDEQRFGPTRPSIISLTPLGPGGWAENELLEARGMMEGQVELVEANTIWS